MITFEQIFQNRAAKGLVKPPAEKILTLDPGETTGWSFFVHGKLQQFGQLNTSSPDIAGKAFEELLDGSYKPIECVMEEYRVYQNRVQQHAGSSLSTPRLIGMLEMLLIQREIPWHKQPAGIAKQFVTDDKLKAWGMWARGQKHARDAIRHGVYYIIFPPKVMTSRVITRSRTAGRHVG